MYLFYAIVNVDSYILQPHSLVLWQKITHSKFSSTKALMLTTWCHQLVSYPTLSFYFCVWFVVLVHQKLNQNPQCKLSWSAVIISWSQANSEPHRTWVNRSITCKLVWVSSTVWDLLLTADGWRLGIKYSSLTKKKKKKKSKEMGIWIYIFPLSPL